MKKNKKLKAQMMNKDLHHNPS
jgi:hypothetical protein